MSKGLVTLDPVFLFVPQYNKANFIMIYSCWTWVSPNKTHLHPVGVTSSAQETVPHVQLFVKACNSWSISLFQQPCVMAVRRVRVSKDPKSESVKKLVFIWRMRRIGPVTKWRRLVVTCWTGAVEISLVSGFDRHTSSFLFVD